MRAIALTAADTPPAPIDLPAPAPAQDQVLVRVHASSVNPVDNAIAAGMLLGMGVEHEFPVTLGRDYAGVVEQVGAHVTGYTPGDQVYGFILHANPAVHDGAWAELVTVPEHSSIGPAPDGADLATAGTAPLSGITAVTAIDALELSDADMLLVVGATGGVGSLAVQLAARAGATIIAPGLPEDEQYLRDLGVSEIVPRDGDDRRARARAPPRRRRRATGPRLLHPRRVRRRAQARRPRRLLQRRRRRRPRPHQRDGLTHPREPPTPRSTGRRRQRCASPCRRPTTSHKRPKRSPRSPAPTPRANSRSRSTEHPLGARSTGPQGRPAQDGPARPSQSRSTRHGALDASACPLALSMRRGGPGGSAPFARDATVLGGSRGRSRIHGKGELSRGLRRCFVA